MVFLYLTSSYIYWNKSEQICKQLVSLNLDLLEREIMEVQNRQEIIAGNSAVKQAVSYYMEESPKINYNMQEEEWFSSIAEQINMDTCYISGIHDREYLVNETEGKREICHSGYL